MIEIGTGGGSIGHKGALGLLKVGPISAGADPGPACYGRGTAATVTDADLHLGYLNADYFLGGPIGGQPEKAPQPPLPTRIGLRVTPAPRRPGGSSIVNPPLALPLPSLILV